MSQRVLRDWLFYPFLSVISKSPSFALTVPLLHNSLRSGGGQSLLCLLCLGRDHGHGSLVVLGRIGAQALDGFRERQKRAGIQCLPGSPCSIPLRAPRWWAWWGSSATSLKQCQHLVEYSVSPRKREMHLRSILHHNSELKRKDISVSSIF